MQPFERLEKEWGEFIGNPNVVVCSSGTSALHLALETLNGSPNFWDYKQVIVPDFTMVACARAVTLAGMIPKFVDCQRNNLLMDSNKLTEMVTLGSIIMPVHVYGRKCNMTFISSLAVKHECKVVEDMAEIHGVKPHPMSDAACWSFYHNKIVAGEEGGAIAFKDPDHVKIAKELRCLGFTDSHDFTHRPRGINARLSNANAAPILRSLDLYSENVAARRGIEDDYDYHLPDEWRMPVRDAPWVYDVRLPFLDIVGPVVRDLNELGIEARQGFKPMSLQDEYRLGTFKERFKRTGGNAYRASREIMYLPLTPSITEGKARYTITALREAVIRHTP